ncbi:S41 family peptidase [Cohnella abietis]|uniref:Carboxy-terminal processing protease CtpB n=1 Tax=Cohnella abietis TaxID=2507935 RepID=A0A3T1DDD4_9BACL|nr:S41 family peptidase [Cohnella abietis]BBI36107.1 carboxy-terminal processing protease CtpB [Cohnella abietis]
MWFRGRTVLAITLLTTIAASIATYAFIELPDWDFKSSNRQEGVNSPIAGGLRQDEIDKVNKALNLIEHRFIFKMDRKELLDGLIHGMVESLHDPFSVYKSREESEQFNEALQGVFMGIGVTLRTDNGMIVVETTIRGSPAEKAGLQPMDILLSVNGESLENVALSEAKNKIRGPKGTKAKLKVRREGTTTPLDLELVRDRIDLQIVNSELGSDGVGRLWINQFNGDTATQVQNELKLMESKGLKALVIDVRNNPGGLLESVIDVADQFVEKGQSIVQYEYKDGKHKVDYAPNGAKNGKKWPLVVLINKGSASAAEILAGALQQSANALLVGETTYGKGTVQMLFRDELGDGSMVKLTVNKWLLPDGTWIHEKGINPDITVSQPGYFFSSKLPRDIVLKFDMTGDAIRNLQNIMEGVGFPADRKDGYFSQATKAALEAFQKREKLVVSGEVDGSTAQRLEELLNKNLHDNPEFDKQWQAALAKARDMIAALS